MRSFSAAVLIVIAGFAAAQPAVFPDLTVVSTRVSGGRVSAVIANRGGAAPSVRPTASLHIHQGARPTRTVDAVVPALGPGETFTVSFDGSVPPGSVYQVEIDGDGRVRETNERNNRTDNQTVPGERTPSGGARRGVTVDPSLAARARSFSAGNARDGRPRPVAVARTPRGGIVAFVENELLVTTKDSKAAKALAGRLGGTIVGRTAVPRDLDVAPTFTIRVDTASAPQNVFGAREAGFAFSSDAARNLLAIAMKENAAGARLGVNLIADDTGFIEKTTVEGGANDGLSLDYMQTGGVYDVDVAGAWKALFHAGRLSSKPILLGIVDRGFGLGQPKFVEKDLDVEVMSTENQPLPAKRWHGTWIAESAAGIPDDKHGATGPGGPVARVAAINTVSTCLDARKNGILKAHGHGAQIINMSFSGSTPRGGMFESAWDNGVEDLEKTTEALHNAGRLLFAAAGNDHIDVDALNEDGDEAEWIYPCENRGVICVGGWFDDTSSKSAGKIPDLEDSNFAAGRGDTIDIWGPICTMVGDDPDEPGADVVKQVCGTSAATPIVSGVATLIWAANPQLSNHQVWEIMNRHAIAAGSIRRVHAYRAVREALMSTRENIAPAVRILSPAPNAALSQAVPTKFVFAGYDVEDEGSCCVATWTIDGALSGSEHSFEGDPLGKKEIKVTITDKGGKKATASVTAVLSNKAPGVKILKAPAGVVTQGLGARFIAGVFDDTSVVALPVSDSLLCGGVVWTSNLDPGLHAAGCDVNIAFKAAGTHVLTATVTDQYGATAKDQKTVGVTVAAPSVLEGSILAPADEQSFHDTERIVLRWTAIGISGVPKTRWTLTDDETGQKRAIATAVVDGMNTFRIGDVFPELTNNVGFRRFTLALTLTTSAGQAADPVAIQISLRPVIH